MEVFCLVELIKKIEVDYNPNSILEWATKPLNYPEDGAIWTRDMSIKEQFLSNLLQMKNVTETTEADTEVDMFAEDQEEEKGMEDHQLEDLKKLEGLVGGLG